MQYQYHSAECASQCLSGTELHNPPQHMNVVFQDLDLRLRLNCSECSRHACRSRNATARASLPSWISPCIRSTSRGKANEADFSTRLNFSFALELSDAAIDMSLFFIKDVIKELQCVIKFLLVNQRYTVIHGMLSNVLLRALHLLVPEEVDVDVLKAIQSAPQRAWTSPPHPPAQELRRSAPQCFAESAPVE